LNNEEENDFEYLYETLNSNQHE